jgi:biotin carboxyl carrier protein
MKLEQIKQLYKAMDDNNFEELDLAIGGQAKIKMRLDTNRHAMAQNTQKLIPINRENEINNQIFGEDEARDENLVDIMAEKVGSFKLNEKIKIAAKVKAGDLLGTIIGISFEEKIKAPVNGIIDEIWLETNDVVGYGMLLFTIKRGEV